jgi:hypothetical protein
LRAIRRSFSVGGGAAISICDSKALQSNHNNRLPLSCFSFLLCSFDFLISPYPLVYPFPLYKRACPEPAEGGNTRGILITPPFRTKLAIPLTFFGVQLMVKELSGIGWQ